MHSNSTPSLVYLLQISEDRAVFYDAIFVARATVVCKQQGSAACCFWGVLYSPSIAKVLPVGFNHTHCMPLYCFIIISSQGSLCAWVFLSLSGNRITVGACGYHKRRIYSSFWCISPVAGEFHPSESYPSPRADSDCTHQLVLIAPRLPVPLGIARLNIIAHTAVSFSVDTE